ncbi:hypothetical protein HPC38_02395 [Pasteurellaceae bacterium HPA106]|uniref:replication protein n=1 Tax=Spirabiliibacterium pneumoniae TaxID=221400 RepID=UPI001F2D0E79|nr:replication protein [Spirabiliibacterium pneumoniae]MBE2895729.1 hypothetical protein [Spirabiliibacterium pneumoniae]
MSNDRFIPNSFQIPNSLVDELLSELSGAELKCYLVTIRKTKGWQKESDAISISQFMEVTGLSNRAVIDACSRLVEIGLLVKSSGSRNTSVYSANLCKKFTSEESSPVKKVHSTCEESSPVKKVHSTCEESSQDPVKKVHTQNNNKNTTKKTNSSSEKKSADKKFKFTDDDIKAAKYILEKIKSIQPNFKEPDNLDNWANEIRLMRERDNRNLREICKLFAWANNDPFWQSNILSPKKLREKWDQLYLKSIAINNAKQASNSFDPKQSGGWSHGKTIKIGGSYER